MKSIQRLLVAIVLFISGSAMGQISVNVQIGAPPQWGPSGYDDVEYYYLPDVQAYYDIRASMFIYYYGNRWIHAERLPRRYRNYDLYHGYKVPMTGYRGNTPYEHYEQHHREYKRGYRGGHQETIGERPHEGNSKYKNKHHKDN